MRRYKAADRVFWRHSECRRLALRSLQDGGEALLASADLLRATAVPPWLCVGTRANIGCASGRRRLRPMPCAATLSRMRYRCNGDRMANFDADTLRELHAFREVTIRTEKHPQTAVVIWVVVADDEVFVRSVRGSKGRWYRDLANGGSATLEFSGRRLEVRSVPASD